MWPVFKFHETPHIRREHMWHILGKNHRLARTGTYIHLKMNFLSYFRLKSNHILIFNSQYNYCRNIYKAFYGSKIFLIKFLHYNHGHYWNYVELLILCGLVLRAIPLSRVYIREISLRPNFFDLKDKVIFIAARSCANKMQNLKAINVWADLDSPFKWNMVRSEGVLIFGVNTI